MECRECGAFNKEGGNFCNICAAPLVGSPKEQAQYVAPKVTDSAKNTVANDNKNFAPEQEEPQTGWGFVRAPKWPTPSFDMNAVDNSSAKVQSSPTKGDSGSNFNPTPASSRPSYAQPTTKAPIASVGDYEEAPIKPYKAPAPATNRSYGSKSSTAYPDGYRQSSSPEYQSQPTSQSNDYSQSTYAGSSYRTSTFRGAASSFGANSMPGTTANSGAYGSTSVSGSGASDYSQSSFDSGVSYVNPNQDANNSYDTTDTYDYSQNDYSSENYEEYDENAYDENGYTHDEYRDDYDNSSEYDYPDDSEDSRKVSRTRPTPSRSRSSRSRRSGGGMLGLSKSTMYWGIGGILVLLIVVFSVILVNNEYGSIGNFFSSVFGGNIVTKDAEVTVGVDENGNEVFTITIYARAGSIVRAYAGEQSKEGPTDSEGKLVINIEKAILMPTTAVDSPTAIVAPRFEILGDEGEVIPVELPEEMFEVDVPMLPLTITQPTTMPVVVSNGMVDISGSTLDGTTALYIEDQQIPVNPDGTFAGSYTLPGLGNYTLTLRAERAGYQIARSTIDVEYNVSEANIEVDALTLRAAEDASSITVKGTIDAGATMSVSGPSGVTVATPSVNEATGIFSFDVEMPAVGKYELTATLTKDGATSTKTIVVERAPKVDEYSFHEYDYDRMTKEPGHTASYELPNCEITEILHAPTASEPYLLARASVDGDEVVLEYRNAKYMDGISVGDVRRPLGDYAGIDQSTGLPLIYVWFVYDN